VHVCVDRQSQRPEALPEPFCKEIERLKSM